MWIKKSSQTTIIDKTNQVHSFWIPDKINEIKADEMEYELSYEKR